MDYIYVNKQNIDFRIPGTLGVIQKYSTWMHNKNMNIYPESLSFLVEKSRKVKVSVKH